MLYTTYSKNEMMKRDLLELVDQLHIKESQELSHELKIISAEMKEWSATETEPVFLDVFVEDKKR